MNCQPIVWMNGELVPADEVRVSPFDLGLAVGWSAFETMLGYHGRVFEFTRHYERLRHSAGVMEVHVPSSDVLSGAIDEVLRANHLAEDRARVRISLSGGNYPLSGGDEANGAHGNVLISAVAVEAPTEQVKVLVSPFPHNERSGISGCKTSSYGNNLMALRRAVSEGADEAVMLNTSGLLCECATANLFLVRDGVVLTPSLSSGCLAGVTRAVVLEICQDNRLLCQEGELISDDLKTADEVFLTSSMRGVQSAVMLGCEDGGIGEMTARIADLYRQRVDKEIAS